jgi:anti-sigma regulatory factor (Ser/Thr protein kinase)
MIATPVTESSQVAEARRRATDAAERAGFGTTDAGRVALVATELATNLMKHGGGGELLVGLYEEPGSAGIELLALDRGRGIASLQSALADGYSSAGTAGNGLGAVFRQSHAVEIASWPGLGTAILARIDSGRPPASKTREHPGWAALSVPMPGETVCGDAYSIHDTETTRTLLVADGLGHGPDAAEAAVQAVRVFQRHRDHQVPTLLDYIHGGLRGTRGAAASIARIDRTSERITFAGIGNVAGVVVTDEKVHRMVSLSGTAGHNARKIQAFDYPYRGGLVILHSDGLGTSWMLGRYPGLAQAHPMLIAAVLYRDFARGRDDATIVVAGGGGVR